MSSERNSASYTDPSSSSRNFLRREYLPQRAVQRHQVIRAETAYEYRECVKLLFVRSGCGSLFVNQTEYALVPGSCFLLYLYHSHKIVPQSGTTIDAYYFLIPYTTFQFLLLSPGSSFERLEFPAAPPHCVFETPQQDELLSLFAEHLPGGGTRDFFFQNIYLFETIAYLNRQCALAEAGRGE